MKATALFLLESMPLTREASWVLRLRGHGPDCALRFREDPARYAEGIPTTFEPAVAASSYDQAPPRGTTLALPPLRGGNPHDLPLYVDLLEAAIPCDILEDHPPRLRLRLRGRAVSGVLAVDTEAGVSRWEPETLPGRVLPVGGRLVSREALLEAFTVPAETPDAPTVTFTDRYAAMGIPYPKPETVCGGHCEGTGWVPVWNTPTVPSIPDAARRAALEVVSTPETDPTLLALWKAAEAENPAEDGWHFVRCPDCLGTGLKAEARVKSPPFTTEGYSPAGRADDNLLQDWRVVASCWAGHSAPGSADRAKVLATAAAIAEELVRRGRQTMTSKSTPLHEAATLRAVLRGSCRWVASVTPGEARELVTGRARVLLMARESARLEGGFVGVCAEGRLYGYARFDRPAVLESAAEVTDMEPLTGVTLDLARESLGLTEPPYYAYRVIDCLPLDLPVDLQVDALHNAGDHGGGRGTWPVAVKEAVTPERVAASSTPELLVIHRRLHEQWEHAVDGGRDHLRSDLARTHLVVEREMRRRGLEHRLSGDSLDESTEATGGIIQAAADVASFLSAVALPSPALAVTGVRRGARGEREVDLWVNATEDSVLGQSLAASVREALPSTWGVNLRFNDATDTAPARLGAFSPVLVLEARPAKDEPGAVNPIGMPAAAAAQAAASRRADAVAPGRAIFMPEPQHPAPTEEPAGGVAAALSLLGESARPILVQPLLDGLRVRLDKAVQSIKVYDRDGAELSLDAVPSLREALRRHPRDFVAEAVIQVYTRQRGLSCGEIHQVLSEGRYDPAADKAATVTITDLLWLDGKDLHALPYGEAMVAAQGLQESRTIRVVRVAVAQDLAEAERLANAMSSVVSSQGFVAKCAIANYPLAGGTDRNRVEYRRDRELRATVLAVEAVADRGVGRPRNVYLLGLRDDQGVMVPCGRTAPTLVRASCGDTLRVSAEGATRMRDPGTAETWYDLSRPRVLEAVPDAADRASEAHAAARASGSSVEQVAMPGEYRRVLERFCPTGKGGGVDNSCGGKGGGGDTSQELKTHNGVELAFGMHHRGGMYYFNDKNMLSVMPDIGKPEDAPHFDLRGDMDIVLKVKAYEEKHWGKGPVEGKVVTVQDGRSARRGVVTSDYADYGNNSLYLNVKLDGESGRIRVPANPSIVKLSKGGVIDPSVLAPAGSMRGSFEEQWERETAAFCPTGKGGGQDNSCPPSRKGGGDGTAERPSGSRVSRTSKGAPKFSFVPPPPEEADKFVTGANGLPYEPMSDFPLNADQRRAEKELGDYLGSDESFDRYAENPETYGGKLINTDIYRDLSADYAKDNDSRTRYTLATHQPSSDMAKQQYAAMLTEPATGHVLIMAGGGGSGKSTVLHGLADEIQSADVIYDAVMSKDKSAFKAIDAALESGRPVHYSYVHRPFESAMDGVASRFDKKGGGRYVPAVVLGDAHVGAQETLLAVAERYKDNPNVKVTIYDNSSRQAKGESAKVKTMTLAEFQKVRYAGSGGKDAVAAAKARNIATAKEKLKDVEAKVEKILSASL